MSKATLQSLLDFLFGMLSANDMRWVAKQLVEQADAEELKPYTIKDSQIGARYRRRQLLHAQ